MIALRMSSTVFARRAFSGELLRKPHGDMLGDILDAGEFLADAVVKVVPDPPLLAFRNGQHLLLERVPPESFLSQRRLRLLALGDVLDGALQEEGGSVGIEREFSL